MQPGKRPTINDVARLSGVSKISVSRVINGQGKVGEAARRRVQEVIAELGYSPDPQARGLAYGRAFLIGLVFENPNPQFVLQMQLGLLDGIRGSGLELVVHPCEQESPAFLTELRRFVERQRLSGVVLVPPVSERADVAELLRDLGCAYVRVACEGLDEPERMLVTDDHLGGRLAAEHLVQLGHRRIAHISGPDGFRSTHERRAGFLEGLAGAGISMDPGLDLQGAYTFASGLEQGRRLLAIPCPPTAVFCGNDEMAAGVLEAAWEHGLPTPERLSVVGFDDFEIAPRLRPALTTIHTPTREIARLAAERLLGLPGPQGGLPGPTLVVRKSTAPPI